MISTVILDATGKAVELTTTVIAACDGEKYARAVNSLSGEQILQDLSKQIASDNELSVAEKYKLELEVYSQLTEGKEKANRILAEKQKRDMETAITVTMAIFTLGLSLPVTAYIFDY